LVSGMAKWVRGVATRMGAGIEIPAPPPTTNQLRPYLYLDEELTNNAVNERYVRLSNPSHEPIQLKLLLEERYSCLFVCLEIQY